MTSNGLQPLKIKIKRPTTCVGRCTNITSFYEILNFQSFSKEIVLIWATLTTLNKKFQKSDIYLRNLKNNDNPHILRNLSGIYL